MKSVLVIQNDAKEGAGQLETLIAEHGLGNETVFGYDTDYDRLEAERYSALVVLGGAQSAYETETYPYLSDEIALCHDFMQAGKPVAGFCLGAQILACALGGDVVPGETKEIGWYDLALTEAGEADAIMAGHPKRLLGYHFHGDRIEDVPGAVVLASSEITPWQLFRYGANAYGFQYHAEVDRLLLEVMCRNNADYMASNGFDAERVIAEGKQNLPAFEAASKGALERWLGLARA